MDGGDVGRTIGQDEAFVTAAWGGDATAVRNRLSIPGKKPSADAVSAALIAVIAYGYNRAEPDGGPTTVNLLIDAGADLIAVDENGDTALIIAARNGQVDLVGKLIQAGSDLDAKNFAGQTASDAASGPMRFRVQKLIRDARSR